MPGPSSTSSQKVIHWHAVDGKLTHDFGPHTATLERLRDKEWRALLVWHVKSNRRRRKTSNCFNTRRSAALWAYGQLNEQNDDPPYMKFAILPAEASDART
jgi:hypothetical protein